MYYIRSSFGSVALTRSYFGQGSIDMTNVVTEVDCNGQEGNLAKCSGAKWGRGLCLYTRQASVICEGKSH